MAEPTIISDAEQLTRLLPTCQRCRRLRRKCDTQLPACRLCQKGKAECTFFDHALQQTLPRSYVHSLMQRLERLKSVQTTVSGGTLPLTSPYQPTSHSRPPSASGFDYRPDPPPQKTVQPGDASFDKHFIVQNANPTCWIYFGSSSPIALAVEVLVHAQAKFGQISHDQSYVSDEFTFNKQEHESLRPAMPRPIPQRHEVEDLINLYLTTTNVLHGYSDSDAVSRDIDIYLRHHGSVVKNLVGQEAHAFFRVSLICAIASANRARHHPEYKTLSCIYYREGLQCIEEVTSDVSPDSLQSLLLLILFAFFWPRKVDIWKVSDYACRLSVELNFHTETGDEFEDEKTKQLRRSLFWGLYCLERTIGQHFGRPSDLPEEIITAEYPATLDGLTLQDGLSQYSLVSHYYRLIYIRSEVSRELYMPASAPDLPMAWYEQRLDQILVWRDEFQGIAQAPGMGTLTCDMGFDTSICFLFQPLLLRALVATKDAEIHHDCTAVIPRESYEAASRLIAFYKMVLEADETTPAGRYPLTILAANYVHQISLMILAHCLLAIDGRLPVIPFSGDLTISPTGPIDFQNLPQIMQTCTMLLSRVASWYPGMIGMYDIFRSVQDKILPVMLEMKLYR